MKKEPHDQTTTATQFLNSRDPASISVPLEQNEQLKVAVVSGPFMQWGSIVTTPLTRLIDQVKAKNVHVLFIVRVFCLSSFISFIDILVLTFII